MQPKRNKFLSVLLMLAAAAGLISGLSAAAYADSIQYQEASYSESAGVTYTTRTTDATALTSTTTAWSNGAWYVVQGSVTVSSRITASGTANLILCDGAALSANAGINVSSDYTLNIYAQSGGTGTLTANGGETGNAGIGGGRRGAGGTIYIHGGTIIATGGDGDSSGGAGIGGGDSGKGGTVYIYGGTVTAAGGLSSAQGIGGGCNGNSDTLTVSGDHLLVFSGSSANPTAVIFSPYSTRHQYMAAAAGYIVSFDKNHDNAAGTMSPQGVRVLSPDLTLAENTFTYPGYTFDHWNTESDDSGTSYADKATITVSKDITLYAQWKTITYTISYNLDGGTGSSANPTSYDIESEDITLENPTKTGYDFTGWSGTSVDVTSSKYVQITQGSTGDRAYTANFTVIVYTISYDLQSGDVSQDNPAAILWTART